MRRRTIIAVVIDRSFSSFRDILRGINRFARAKGDWHLEFFSPAENYVQHVRDLQPEGLILSWVGYAEGANAVLELVPRAVGVCGQHERLGIHHLPQVESDDEGVGEAAANHFLKKGFTYFAFVGAEFLWSHRRWTGFERAIRKAGFIAADKVFKEELLLGNGGGGKPIFAAELAAWLESLPKPLAVLACCDRRGLDVSTTCRDENIFVPDDVAILGVDDDDLDCELSHPPLSSVRIPWQRIGEEAASLLQRILSGEKIKPDIYGVPPVGVIERQSTDTLAISDRELSAAIRFIRNHAHEPIGVEDVMSEIAVSRRSMESRFRKLLGRSPLDEIRRVRVDLAKQLLASTELAMPTIAERCGFSNAARFSRVFHDSTEESPSNYRRRYRR